MPQPVTRESSLATAIESMTLLVAAVIVHNCVTNSVVLLQRGPQAKFALGMWDLPAGKSAPGEPIIETAVRELREETGLTVDPADLRVVHIIHSSFGVESPNGFLTVVFVANTWLGELANLEPDKHAQVDWVETHSIPEDFVDTTGSALRRYLTGGPNISLAGWPDTASEL